MWKSRSQLTMALKLLRLEEPPRSGEIGMIPLTSGPSPKWICSRSVRAVGIFVLSRLEHEIKYI